MLYAIICKDKPDSLQLRLDTRPTHLAYIESLGDAVKLGGPFLGEDQNPFGTLLIVEAESLEKAQEIADNDPYVAAGLFASREVTAWNWVLKKSADA
ncbi:hypothetical protein GCM10011385_13850 [Nitratireductor aestuarii]|uniref:YCII-related domain-containing protein n=1 Tax=Nitratireductor aestuarii TaxID=1735103 RepID=A0A916RLS7_9HYPH|nr:YciI family protein [Nitratireductor aestuarii]GGA61394.1 hypothetical protein GCM10011385_13850 [Nitratireductor aestuarii]